MCAGHLSSLILVFLLAGPWGFNRAHDRLATGLNVDVADRNLFGLFAAQLFQRFEEVCGDCGSLQTVPKIEVTKLMLPCWQTRRLGQTIETRIRNAYSKH